MTNAFTIPKESAVLAQGRRHFPSKVQRFHQNLSPIVLPNSSKFVAPAMMKKPGNGK